MHMFLYPCIPILVNFKSGLFRPGRTPILPVRIVVRLIHQHVVVSRDVDLVAIRLGSEPVGKVLQLVEIPPVRRVPRVRQNVALGEAFGQSFVHVVCVGNRNDRDPFPLFARFRLPRKDGRFPFHAAFAPRKVCVQQPPQRPKVIPSL